MLLEPIQRPDVRILFPLILLASGIPVVFAIEAKLGHQQDDVEVSSVVVLGGMPSRCPPKRRAGSVIGLLLESYEDRPED